jgi:4-amino-4-deoxy-L-arabinose transferase-like glycosyltransferase
MQQPDLNTQPRALAQPWASLRGIPAWLTALLLGVLALLPRIIHLDDFFTEDESFHWVWRVRHFAGAIRQEHWADTNLTGHPGVTTMWLGTLGRWLAEQFGVPLAGLAEGSASIEYLALLRMPLALVNTLAVVLGYLLLRRLLPPTTALLAALLWALAPFVIAHSRLLHVDALLTSTMTLSLLLLLVALFATPQVRAGALWTLAASGALGGLALLTKAPSLVLLPVVGLLLLAGAPAERGVWRRLWWAAGRYGLWLACAVAVFYALWPAMWVAPAQAVGAVLAEVADNGAVPHHTGNYFLGCPVADPGWLFYPVALLWRGTPFLLLGLLLLPLLWRRIEMGDTAEARRERYVLLALGLFVLLFGLALTLAAKKFDRYLLPAWPALAVLAAAGWSRLLVWLAATRRGAPHAARLWPGLSLLVAGILSLTLLWYHPYYLAYFNPLLGGGTTARHVLLVGWGEGMERVGAWLRARPDVTRSPVLTWGPRTLEPFVPGRTAYLNAQNLEQPASYAVLYVRAAQRQESAAAQELLQQQPPLYTLSLHGIEYARVYQPPRPYDEPVGALFGEGLHLRGFSQQIQDDGRALVITPAWDVQAAMPGGWFSFVHVLDAEGRRIAQIDAPIDEGLFDEWQAGQQFGGPLPIALPPDAPPGPYRVALGVYRPDSGERLPLRRGAALPPDLAGPHALHLTTIPAQP